MINSIKKSKIPREYGYVLKTEQFNQLFSDNNISTYIDLIYSNSVGIVLSAWSTICGRIKKELKCGAILNVYL